MILALHGGTDRVCPRYVERPEPCPVCDAVDAAVREALEAGAVELESGKYCRYTDHMQGFCDCKAMAAAIRARMP